MSVTTYFVTLSLLVALLLAATATAVSLLLRCAASREGGNGPLSESGQRVAETAKAAATHTGPGDPYDAEDPQMALEGGIVAHIMGDGPHSVLSGASGGLEGCVVVTIHEACGQLPPSIGRQKVSGPMVPPLATEVKPADWQHAATPVGHCRTGSNSSLRRRQFQLSADEDSDSVEPDASPREMFLRGSGSTFKTIVPVAPDLPPTEIERYHW